MRIDSLRQQRQIGRVAWSINGFLRDCCAIRRRENADRKGSKHHRQLAMPLFASA
jgi:hypothetical protein